MPCPSCGAEAREDDRFCAIRGRRLLGLSHATRRQPPPRSIWQGMGSRCRLVPNRSDSRRGGMFHRGANLSCPEPEPQRIGVVIENGEDGTRTAGTSWMPVMGRRVRRDEGHREIDMAPTRHPSPASRPGARRRLRRHGRRRVIVGDGVSDADPERLIESHGISDE